MKLIKKGIGYLRNQEIDIRTRMLFFLEYVVLFACVIGTIAMIAFTTSFIVLIPNFVLIITVLIGIYFSQFKKKYELSACIIVCGCAYISLPFMFFTSGGNKSGMPIWFVFGVVFICMMLKGKLRVFMSVIGIAISVACMLIGYYYPNTVMSLKNEQAVFMDMVQSFLIVSVIVCVCLYIYIFSYDEQQQILVKQSDELKKIMYTDALTGIYNRHAYYDASSKFSGGLYQDDLVIVAMDVNGLKRVNDTCGHAAGDELIKNATAIMIDAYSKYGKIYRTGGDEFVAILFFNEEADRLYDILETTIKYTNEKNGSDISLAAGVAAWKENSEKNYFELEKLADSKMYINKSNYYKSTGIDRRKR